jgi:hypothetical protein
MDNRCDQAEVLECVRAEDMGYLVRIMTHIRVDMHTQKLKRIR